jgi:hypothetical protein
VSDSTHDFMMFVVDKAKAKIDAGKELRRTALKKSEASKIICDD